MQEIQRRDQSNKKRVKRIISNYYFNILVSRSKKGFFTFILFLLIISIFALSSIKAVAGIDKSGIIAQVATALGLTQTTNTMTGSQVASLVSAGTAITEDAVSRCRVIDPYSNPIETKMSVAPPIELTGKSGINEGTTMGGEGATLDFVTGKNTGTKNLNMNYIISIATSPSDIGSTVSFIENANKAGFVPIAVSYTHLTLPTIYSV